MSDPKVIPCPHCGQLNRVQAHDMARSPDCGQCHQPLFTGHSVALDEANFAKQVGKSQIPVLVDFWAPWCGPCRQMAPAFEQAAAALVPHVRLAKVNTEEATQLGTQFGIRSIPTLVLFQNGKEVARQAGAMGSQDIVRWVNQHRQP